MDDTTRIVLSSTAEALRVVNYSMNFYLYCVANDDIRKAAVKIVKSSYISKKFIELVQFVKLKIV